MIGAQQAPVMPVRHPWLKFHPADWQGDERLSMCSLGARGLLIEFICIMHRATPYGHLLVNERVPTDAELARLVRATSIGELKRLRAELLDRGVLSRTSDGVVFSRRMVRKATQSAVGHENGKRGGNPALRPLSVAVNPSPNAPPITEPLTGVDKTQKLEARSQTPQAPLSVLTSDELGDRAGAFLRRYPGIYAKCRAGAHYQPKEARDFPTALELVAAHTDDERLDAMLEVFLRMQPDACRGMNRPGTVNQFAHMAPECDHLLRENGR